MYSPLRSTELGKGSGQSSDVCEVKSRRMEEVWKKRNPPGREASEIKWGVWRMGAEVRIKNERGEP